MNLRLGVLTKLVLTNKKSVSVAVVEKIAVTIIDTLVSNMVYHARYLAQNVMG